MLLKPLQRTNDKWRMTIFTVNFYSGYLLIIKLKSPIQMYYIQAKTLYRNGLKAQAPQKSYPCSTCQNSAIALFWQQTRDRWKPSLHQGFSDCTHVKRLKNRGKPHGEAVLIFCLGELQLNWLIPAHLKVGTSTLPLNVDFVSLRLVM